MKLAQTTSFPSERLLSGALDVYDLDHKYQTMTWLDCSSKKERGKKVVVQLKCKVCSDFVEKHQREKNFSEKWIVGADSVRLCNVHDHVQNNQHTHSISLLKKKHAESAGLDPSGYAPIARAFNKLTDGEKEKLKLKFDIANFVATENFPLLLYNEHWPAIFHK